MMNNSYNAPDRDEQFADLLRQAREYEIGIDEMMLRGMAFFSFFTDEEIAQANRQADEIAARSKSAQ